MNYNTSLTEVVIAVIGLVLISFLFLDIDYQKQIGLWNENSVGIFLPKCMILILLKLP